MDREIRTLSDAITLLDEWIAAYNELRIAHSRLMGRYLDARAHLSHAQQAIHNDLWIEAQLAKPRESECPF